MLWYALGVITGLLVALIIVVLHKVGATQTVVHVADQKLTALTRNRQATIVEPDFLDTLGV